MASFVEFLGTWDSEGTWKEDEVKIGWLINKMQQEKDSALPWGKKLIQIDAPF